MSIQWWEIIGLIGITLVLSSGKIFDGIRNWLLGFDNWWSPFRIVGNLLSCSMCCGVWVGFLWVLLVKQWSWHVAFVFGGCISISSLIVDELVGIISLYRLIRRRKEKGALTLDELLAARQQSRVVQKKRLADQMSQSRARRRGTPKDLTEEEADAYADAQDVALDSLFMGEPPDEAS